MTRLRLPAWLLPAWLLVGAVLLAGPAAAQQRIVSLGGATTETVFALGAGGLLVGADTTSTYPAATSALPKVGYVRALSAEGMLSLSPDLLLAAPEAGPPPAIAGVASAGVSVVRLPEGTSVAAMLERVAAVGAALHRPAEAASLAAALRDDLAAVQRQVATATDRPRVMFLMRAGKGAPMAAGRATAADAMIALAGGENATAGFPGYRTLSPESAIAAAPDVVLMFQDTVAEMGGAAAVLALPELAPTPAARGGRLVAMDAMYLLGFGPRTPYALRDLAMALHPGLPAPSLPVRTWSAP